MRGSGQELAMLVVWLVVDVDIRPWIYPKGISCCMQQTVMCRILIVINSSAR